MPTTRCDPRLDAGIVAATLRALGYAARSYSAPGEDGRSTRVRGGDPHRVHRGVAVPRWPLGNHRPPGPSGRRRPIRAPYLAFQLRRRVPEPTSAAALAAWVAAQLPPPDLPEYRVYWQFSPPSTPPAAAPAHWARQWCEHWSRGGADVISPVATSSRDDRDLLAHHGAAP